jgi:hypothetical protein
MRNLIPVVILSATFLGYQAGQSQTPNAPKADSATQVAASTYEHLATAIIEIEATEDDLVKSILIGYYTAAEMHLKAAARDAQGRVAHLEAAAAEVANIANEGDKRIQAVRQRLAKAGHTHNTDIETKGDYMFVTNREKKGLLDLASRIGRAGGTAFGASKKYQASPQDVDALGAELSRVFQAAIAPE